MRLFSNQELMDGKACILRVLYDTHGTYMMQANFSALMFSFLVYLLSTPYAIGPILSCHQNESIIVHESKIIDRK